MHEGVVGHSRLTTGPVGPVYGRAIATSPYRQRRPTGSTTGDYSISANLILVIFWLCATCPVNVLRHPACPHSLSSQLKNRTWITSLRYLCAARERFGKRPQGRRATVLRRARLLFLYRVRPYLLCLVSLLYESLFFYLFISKSRSIERSWKSAAKRMSQPHIMENDKLSTTILFIYIYLENKIYLVSCPCFLNSADFGWGERKKKRNLSQTYVPLPLRQ